MSKSGMAQFRGTDWGEAFGNGVIRGIAIGNQYRSSKAQSDYQDGVDEVNAQYEADMETAGEDKDKLLAAQHTRDEGMARLKQNYYTYLGNIEQADKAYGELRDTQFNAAYDANGQKDPYSNQPAMDLKTLTSFASLGGGGGSAPTMVASNGPVQGVIPAEQTQGVPTNANGTIAVKKNPTNVQVAPQQVASQYDAKGADAYRAELAAMYKKDPSAREKAMLEGYNSDLYRMANGESLARTENGQYQLYKNGKTLGSPFQLPAEMLNRMVELSIDRDVTDKFGQAPAAGGVGSVGPTAPAEGNGGRSYRGQYNTKLSEKDEAEYQKWAKRTGRGADEEDYDMRGAWLEAKKKGVSLEDEKGHFPDKYKKPNHPTFSNESKYNGAEGVRGGTWGKTSDGRDMYTPGRDLSDEEAQNLQKYFAEREPNAVLNLQGRQSQQRPQAMLTADNTSQQGSGTLPSSEEILSYYPRSGQNTTVTTKQKHMASTTQGFSDPANGERPTATEDIKQLLAQVRSMKKNPKLDPLVKYLIQNEAKVDNYYNAYFRRFRRWPTGAERARLVTLAQLKETQRHNAYTESNDDIRTAEYMRHNRTTEAQARAEAARKAMELGSTTVENKPEKFTIGDPQGGEGRREIIGGNGLPNGYELLTIDTDTGDRPDVMVPKGMKTENAQAAYNFMVKAGYGKPMNLPTGMTVWPVEGYTDANGRFVVTRSVNFSEALEICNKAKQNVLDAANKRAKALTEKKKANDKARLAARHDPAAYKKLATEQQKTKGEIEEAEAKVEAARKAMDK